MEQFRPFIPEPAQFSSSLVSASAVPVAFQARKKAILASEEAEKASGPATLPLRPSWALQKPPAHGAPPAQLNPLRVASAAQSTETTGRGDIESAKGGFLISDFTASLELQSFAQHYLTWHELLSMQVGMMRSSGMTSFN